MKKLISVEHYVEQTSWKSCFLETAARRLYKHDRHLLERGKERSAAAKIACHLWELLGEVGYRQKCPRIRVNVDYGREGNDPKRGLEGKVVIPDIIVHVPGLEGPNIAVVEVKGWWNRDDRKTDMQKLHSYTRKQKYFFAYSIELGETCPTVTLYPDMEAGRGGV